MTLAIVNLFHEKVGKNSSTLASSDDKFMTCRESSFLTVRGQFRSLFSKNS